MTLNKGIAAIALLVSAPFVLADETECETVQTDMVSMYTMAVVGKDKDLGKYYQSQVDRINELAGKYQWQDFKLTSQDFSVSTSSYGQDQYELSVSLSFQFRADYKAVSQLTKEADAYSISFSRYEEVNCPDDYSY